MIDVQDAGSIVVVIKGTSSERTKVRFPAQLCWDCKGNVGAAAACGAGEARSLQGIIDKNILNGLDREKPYEHSPSFPRCVSVTELSTPVGKGNFPDAWESAVNNQGFTSPSSVTPIRNVAVVSGAICRKPESEPRGQANVALILYIAKELVLAKPTSQENILSKEIGKRSGGVMKASGRCCP